MTLQDPLPRISISEIDPTLSVLEHALAYGRDGLRVVFVWAPTFGGSSDPTTEHPVATGCTCKNKAKCSSTGKHPIANAWQKLATHEEQSIKDQYVRFSQQPSVGIELGEQGNGTYIVAIDIDDEERSKTLQGELGILPETARCDSGRGYRLFYEIPSEISTETLQNVTGIGGESGVDAKAKGGQVVVAPSWHPNGKRYKWSKYNHISTLPLLWALKLVKHQVPKWAKKNTLETIKLGGKEARKAERYFETALRGQAVTVSACGKGLRNNTLYECAVSIFSLCNGMKLFSWWTEVHRLLSVAAENCGLTESETYKTLRSADEWVRATQSVRVPVLMPDPPKSMPPEEGKDAVPNSVTPQERPVIRISTELFDNVQLTIKAMRADLNLYQRDGYLIHTTRVSQQESDESQLNEHGRELVEGSPQIRTTSLATLRSRLTKIAIFQKYDMKSSSWRPTLPTDSIVGDVHDCGEWPGIRTLIGICETPTMRVDGTIIQEAGYDRSTRYLYAPNMQFPKVSDTPSQDDARAAYQALVDIFYDFPYVNSSHMAVPIAAILSLIARPAIQGAVPGFLFNASTRGSGKTLQTDAIAMVATGRGAPRMNYPTTEEEMEKILASYALRGAPFFCLDNVSSSRPFGGGPLDRVLTARDQVQLRVLGRTEVPTVSWRAVLMATGNNMDLFADTARRVLISRLEPKDEHPERRTNFRHDDLLGWIGRERGRLVAAGLTILRAYVVAGRPKIPCERWGSFEEWCAFVPPAIMFAGGANPMLARPLNDEEVDSETRAFSFVMSEIERLGLTDFKIGAFLETLYSPRPVKKDELGNIVVESDGLDELREAIETLCPPKWRKNPDAVALGNKFRAFKGRYIDGKRLLSRPGNGGTLLWGLEKKLQAPNLSDQRSST